jgi:uncharacterized membrane protein YkvA (DUF1232 family)
MHARGSEEASSSVARSSRADRDQQQGSGAGRRDRRVGWRRLLGWAAFLPLASRAPIYGRLFWELIIDDRTPVGRKAMLGAAIGYLVLGRDLVPDDIPLIGGLDDLVVVVLAVDVFLDGVPADVLHEKLDALGIDRREFTEDVARIRRFMPGPVRRLIRQVPRMVTFAGDTLENSRVGPRVRAWINREDSIA